MMMWLFNSDCCIVKGYNRSAIYDLTREKVIFIPNILANLLNDEAVDFLGLERFYNDWFQLLIDNEIIYKLPSEAHDMFPRVKTTYHNYFPIHTITLLLNSINKQFIEIFNNEYLFNYNIKVVLLCINKLTYETHLETISKHLYSSTVEKLIIISNSKYFLSGFNELEISQIISDSPIKSYIRNQKNLPTKNRFVINQELFFESMNYNVFFNGKIFLNDECKPFYDYYFLHAVPLNYLKRDVYENIFSKAKKDVIDICKDCEFRHMCVDSRLPSQREDKSWYHKTECNYNPYICKWEGEEGYQTLEECGVISNVKGFSIDHEKITAINKILWEEEKEDA